MALVCANRGGHRSMKSRGLAWVCYRLADACELIGKTLAAVGLKMIEAANRYFR
jgi:hypothetical protein